MGSLFDCGPNWQVLRPKTYLSLLGLVKNKICESIDFNQLILSIKAWLTSIFITSSWISIEFKGRFLNSVYLNQLIRNYLKVFDAGSLWFMLNSKGWITALKIK